MESRIRYIRKQAGLTQVEFGETIGVKGNTITNYENGMRNPTDAVILSICREFNVNEDWLKSGIGEPYKKRTRTQEIGAFAGDIMKESDETFRKRFVLALSKLDERDWETLEKIVDALKKED